ncbi:crotonyl-CoA carboxylase/reductase [Amycolatopsis coloradensis]|uniref:Crotonyl-CoA carboxylase/reductase n=1 Tax=Amycolatopsis coloradensis TaxID=76021 RepID=A0ACD5BHD4_9PSEU
MDALAEAVVKGAPREDLERIPVPDEFVAVHTRTEDVGMFQGVEDKDVRRSLRIGPVPMPALAADEVLIAVMASGINYNTVWSATFDPVPTFAFLKYFGRQGGDAARHDQRFHVLGSDAAGVVVRAGSGVRRWTVGDHVVVATAHVDHEEPSTHGDSMLGGEQRAWGFETNFGGLAQYAVVRASQLLAKPPHLTWEEAAASPLCAGTAYRMLVGEHGARIKQGDVVLIWGAAGGLGVYAAQFVRNGGGIAVGVVSSEERAESARLMGCEHVINRRELDLEDPVTGGKQLGKRIRKAVGDDPHVVFEHVGRETFGLSVFVAGRGGTIVTCGSSTGFQHEFDNRYLWMRLKRVIGSHGANLQEQWEVNRLITLGRVKSALSVVYPLAEAAEAARLVQENLHLGKVGVLALAPEEGLGVTDPVMREKFGADIAPLMA